MAIREELVLDLSQALSQLDDLERQLDALIQPIVIPVKVDDDAGLERLARDADRAEDEFEDLRQEVDRTDDELEKVERQAKKTGDDLERAGKKGEKSFKGLTKGILAFGAALGGIAALRAVGGFFADSIKAASDLEESVGKATVVFGEFFGDIEKFTETAPQALGLSTAAALEMTGTFGNLFVALGLSRQAAAELAPDIVQLGADLASFNNLEVTDALDKLRAGLVGEAEPLRALGVNLTAATTNAKALELGLVDVNGVVTEAGKVQARYALILEQTQTAQGDFARTSDGLANTLRTLAGEFDNFKAGVGEALVPAFEAIIAALPPMLVLMEDLIPLIADMSSGFADAVADGEGLVTVLQNIATTIGATSDVLSGFGGFAVGIIEGIGQIAFGARVDKAFESWTDAMDDFDETFTNLSIRKIKGTLFEALAEIDADPIEALVESLESLQFLDLDIETFTSTVERFFRIAGVDGPEALRIFQALSTRGGDFKFTAEQVAVLDAVMRELFGITGALPPSIDEVARGLERAGEAARTGSVKLSEFTLEGERLRRIKVDDVIAELESQFGKLPDALDAARDALRDTQGEIVTDFSVFLDNLDAELTEREDFADLFARLIGEGFPLLAELLVSEGLDAVEAFTDGLTDPAALARGEARLEEFGRRLARAEANAFLAELLTVLDNASDLIVEITPILGDLDFGVLPILPNIIIPGTGQGTTGDVTIIQNFDNTPSPNTETERAAQAVASIFRD